MRETQAPEATEPPSGGSTAYSLLEAREVDTYSEEWRHECECRSLAKAPTDARRRIHKIIIAKRGQRAGERIERDVKTLRLMKALFRSTEEQIMGRFEEIVHTYGYEIAERAVLLLKKKRARAEEDV